MIARSRLSSLKNNNSNDKIVNSYIVIIYIERERHNYIKYTNYSGDYPFFKPRKLWTSPYLRIFTAELTLLAAAALALALHAVRHGLGLGVLQEGTPGFPPEDHRRITYTKATGSTIPNDLP